MTGNISKNRKKEALLKRLEMIGVAVTLGILILWVLIPIYWMVVTSLKPTKEIYAFDIHIFPQEVTTTQYKKLFDKNFLLYLRNSLIIASSTAFLSLMISSLASYALTRLRFVGQHLFSRITILVYLFPSSLLFIPLFGFFSGLNLVDSKVGMVLAHLTFTVPYSTWMLMAYFRSIPASLEEAALVDGATRLVALRKIVFPLAAPAIVVTIIYSFTLSWNEFLYALVFTKSEHVKPFTAGLTGLIMGDVFEWGQLMAGSVIGSLPVILLYLAMQKYVVSGLTLGSVKE